MPYYIGWGLGAAFVIKVKADIYREAVTTKWLHYIGSVLIIGERKW